MTTDAAMKNMTPVRRRPTTTEAAIPPAPVYVELFIGATVPEARENRGTLNLFHLSHK